MTKKEFWLKLFQENDTALACAIHLCERFVDENQLQNGAEFIAQKRMSCIPKYHLSTSLMCLAIKQKRAATADTRN